MLQYGADDHKIGGPLEMEQQELDAINLVLYQHYDKTCIEAITKNVKHQEVIHFDPNASVAIHYTSIVLKIGTKRKKLVAIESVENVSDGELNKVFKAGDLIVTLNGTTFDADAFKLHRDPVNFMLQQTSHEMLILRAKDPQVITQYISKSSSSSTNKSVSKHQPDPLPTPEPLSSIPSKSICAPVPSLATNDADEDVAKVPKKKKNFLVRGVDAVKDLIKKKPDERKSH